MAAFERVLARLVADQPQSWLLKGGLALQWRLGERARTAQDLDILLVGPSAGVRFIFGELPDGQRHN